MIASITVPLVGFLLSNFIIPSKTECPSALPIEIDGNCYNFVTDLHPYKDAKDNCNKKGNNIGLVSIKSKKIIDQLQKEVYKYLEKKYAAKSGMWIGLKMSDRGMSKDAKDRDWSWAYDDTKFVQKDYTLWDTEGGPTDKNLGCALIDHNNDFLVHPVKCNDPTVPVVCIMEDGKKCEHDISPYLVFGDYCLAPLYISYTESKIRQVCNPGKPAPYKEEMKRSVVLAAKNLFLGGGVLVNIQRIGSKFKHLSDYTEVDPDLWEENEPRDGNDCAALVFQDNYELKLKSMNCKYYITSLCGIEPGMNGTLSSD